MTREALTGRYIVKVSRAEREAARLQIKIDQMEGRVTSPHIRAIADAKPAKTA